MHTQIAVSLSLIALTAGMFLLAKTNKDSLGMTFKLASWIVILFSFLVFLCAAVQGFQQMFGHHDRCGSCSNGMKGCHENGVMAEKDCCEMGMDKCGHGHGMMNCDMMACDTMFDGTDTIITKSGCCKMANGDSMKIEKRIVIKTK